MMKISLALIVVVIAVLVVLYVPIGKPDVVIEGAKFMRSPMMKNAGAAFMLITNNGKSDDRLSGCSIKEFPSVRGELHTMTGGKMFEIEEIIIPAGEITVLKKGSLHLMFFDLPEELGESVTVILEFEKSGTIEVTDPL